MGLPLPAVSYRKPKAQDPSKFVPLEVLMRGVRIFWKSRKAADPLHLIAKFTWLHFLVLSASIHSVTLLASRAFPAVAGGRQTFQAGWPSRIREGGSSAVAQEWREQQQLFCRFKRVGFSHV